MSDEGQIKSIIGQRELRICGLAEIGRSRFDYDPLTGDLRFKDPGPGAYGTLKGYRIFKRKCVGKIARTPHSSGYICVNVLGQSILAHRLIWAIVTGRDPGVTIDHIDGDRANNRWANLREATRSQNAMNRRVRSDNTSGATGVCWHAATRQWAASIGSGKTRVHLGLFDDIVSAKRAYRAAASQRHGEYAAHYGVRAGAA